MTNDERQIRWQEWRDDPNRGGRLPLELKICIDTEIKRARSEGPAELHAAYLTDAERIMAGQLAAGPLADAIVPLVVHAAVHCISHTPFEGVWRREKQVMSGTNYYVTVSDFYRISHDAARTALAEAHRRGYAPR